MKCSDIQSLELRTLGICLVPFHLPCQQPTSCRPCTPSPQSCKDWQWSSSGCTGTLTCTVGTYPVRKIITGETAMEAFGDSIIFLHTPFFLWIFASLAVSWALMQLQVKLCWDLLWAGGKWGPDFWHKMRVVEFPIAQSPLIGVFIGMFSAIAASTCLSLPWEQQRRVAGLLWRRAGEEFSKSSAWLRAVWSCSVWPAVQAENACRNPGAVSPGNAVWDWPWRDLWPARVTPETATCPICRAGTGDRAHVWGCPELGARAVPRVVLRAHSLQPLIFLSDTSFVVLKWVFFLFAVDWKKKATNSCNKLFICNAGYGNPSPWEGVEHFYIQEKLQKEKNIL